MAATTSTKSTLKTETQKESQVAKLNTNSDLGAITSGCKTKSRSSASKSTNPLFVDYVQNSNVRGDRVSIPAIMGSDIGYGTGHNSSLPKKTNVGSYLSGSSSNNSVKTYRPYRSATYGSSSGGYTRFSTGTTAYSTNAYDSSYSSNYCGSKRNRYSSNHCGSTSNSYGDSSFDSWS